MDINFDGEEFYTWDGDGIFKFCPCTRTVNGNKEKYVFYTGMKEVSSNSFSSPKKFRLSAGQHQLSAVIEKDSNQPISDREICEAFVLSISKKMLSDAFLGEKEYVDCLRTLPKGFFTQENVDLVLDQVIARSLEKSRSLQTQAKQSKSEAERLKVEASIKQYSTRVDAACCDLMEYAQLQNSQVQKGTGKEHIGE